MMKSVALLVLMVLLVSAPIVCPAQNVPSTITSANWATDRGSRRSQAVEWLREISDLDKQIPALSPAEEAWLKVEYDDQISGGGDMRRATRARISKEGAARFAKPITRGAVAILEELASSRTLTEGNEVVLWCRLMALTLDLNFWGDVQTLGDLGVLTPRSKSKSGISAWPGYQQAFHQLWASRAQRILDAIVLSYLASPRR